MLNFNVNAISELKLRDILKTSDLFKYKYESDGTFGLDAQYCLKLRFFL